VNDPRLANVLQAASGRIQAAISAALDKVAVQLPTQAMAATSGTVRQQLMEAERDIRLKSSRIQQGFAQALKVSLDKVSQPHATSPQGGGAELDWSALSLVDDDEVERGVMADRLGQALTLACDEHLKALYALSHTLMGDDGGAERNPLRPQAVAKALFRGLGDAECTPDSCQTLSGHIARLLGPELNAAYGIIVGEMRHQGIEARLPGLRARGGASGHTPFSTSTSGAPTTDFGALPSRSGGQLDPSPQRSGGPAAAPGMGTAQLMAHQRAAQALSDMFGVSLPTAPMALEGTFMPTAGTNGSTLSQAAAQAARADFQHLLRQLAVQAPSLPASLSVEGDWHDPLAGGVSQDAPAGFAGQLMAVNLIRAHREELVRASGGAPIDQIVIDIVAALFDQVLSDPKVAPQMARQIARLQMPVLRVALGDIGFFNSRKHPVRRFVNRVATLSAAFDDFDQGPGKACLEHVVNLVNAIVEGDFDSMAVYEVKLAELEGFVDQETQRDAAEHAAVAALLSGKEADLRVQQRYMQILKRELADVELPEFVRDFLTQIWSQVQVMASARDGADSLMAQRMKKAGHTLALSVQPKGHPQLRKAFLQGLPQLMRDINEGLSMIQWPEEAKQAFFAQLLPAHAECLKAAPHHDLTQRMLEQRLHKVEQIAIPSREDAANDPLPTQGQDSTGASTLTVVPALSQEEVRQAGFVPEAAVSGEAPLDIDLDSPSDPSFSDIDINLDAPPTPAAGPQLVHHIQKGTAYQMLMQGQWKKVRLTWISEGRTFFIFTHGNTHKQTISLTARTLAKMCDSRRFKAFEQSELLERATLRARRQLAALNADSRTRSAA